MIPVTLTSPEPIGGIRVGYSLPCRLYNGDQSARVVADSSVLSRLLVSKAMTGMGGLRSRFSISRSLPAISHSSVTGKRKPDGVCLRRAFRIDVIA
ncbi:MAG: hypothetical protein QGI34_11905 [Candidatus Latescibacteria bacterium]|nr:hypothetical protein [Candidatus Latescibacterota bacterium]